MAIGGKVKLKDYTSEIFEEWLESLDENYLDGLDAVDQMSYAFCAGFKKACELNRQEEGD